MQSVHPRHLCSWAHSFRSRVESFEGHSWSSSLKCNFEPAPPLPEIWAPWCWYYSPKATPYLVGRLSRKAAGPVYEGMEYEVSRVCPWPCPWSAKERRRKTVELWNQPLLIIQLNQLDCFFSLQTPYPCLSNLKHIWKYIWIWNPTQCDCFPLSPRLGTS